MTKPRLFSASHYSISTRLALWYGASLIVLMGLIFTVVTVGFIGTLHRDVDRRLMQERQRLLPSVAFVDSAPTWTGSAEDFLLAAGTSTSGSVTFLRLLSAEGRVLYQSPNFSGHLPLSIKMPRAVKEAKVSRHWGLAMVRSLYTPLTTSTGTLRGWLEISVWEYSTHHSPEVYLFLVLGSVKK